MLSGSNAQAGDFDFRFPDTPAPPGAQWQWVGQQMIINGVQTSVKLFTFRGDEADMIRHFHQAWEGQGNGKFFERDMGDEHMLGHSTPEKYSTVQYKRHGETIEGKICVSQSPLAPRRPMRPSVPIAPGAKLQSFIESRDVNIDSESVTLESIKPVKQNVAYYENQLKANDWIRLGGKFEGESFIAQYQSVHGQLQLSIKHLPGTDRNSSQILIHLLKQ